MDVTHGFQGFDKKKHSNKCGKTVGSFMNETHGFFEVF
jgi:hypothetical protein